MNTQISLTGWGGGARMIWVTLSDTKKNPKRAVRSLSSVLCRCLAPLWAHWLILWLMQMNHLSCASPCPHRAAAVEEEEEEEKRRTAHRRSSKWEQRAVYLPSHACGQWWWWWWWLRILFIGTFKNVAWEEEAGVGWGYIFLLLLFGADFKDIRDSLWNQKMTLVRKQLVEMWMLPWEEAAWICCGGSSQPSVSTASKIHRRRGE